MERVYEFLKKAGVYYLATVSGDQPHVRPFGTINLFDGKLYIQTGKSKEVSRQIAADPKIEISAMVEDDQWIRLTGTLVEDDRIEAQTSMLEAYPHLKAMYQPGDGNTVVYYLKDAEASFCSFTAPAETVRW